MDRHGEELAVIGMAGLDQREQMQAFVDEFDLPFPNVVSEDGSLWPRFDIALQGAWYFLDDDGTGEVVPYDLTGPELAERLDELLAS